VLHRCEPRTQQHVGRRVRGGCEGHPHAEDQGRCDHPRERVRTVETREERFRPHLHLLAGQEGRGSGQGFAERQHGDARYGTDGDWLESVARWSGPISRHDRVSRSGHASGDGRLGWAGRQGLDEVLGPCPLAAMTRLLGHLILVVAVSVFAATAVAQAQPGADITVDELVARALADSPDLRASRAEIEAATGRLQQAGLRPNPMLELGGQKALSSDNNVTVGLSVPLDLNGRKEGRVGVAERELQMKRAQVRDRERRLIADVRMKAGELLAAQRSLSVTDDLIAVNRDALRLVQNRVREGATPSLEENLMLVEVNRLDAMRQMLTSRVDIASLQLKALVGMPPEAPLPIRP